MSIKSPYHLANLNTRFDALWNDYQTGITWEELYLWYGVQKVMAGTYRDLLERWALYVVERGGAASDAYPISVFLKRHQGPYAAILRLEFPEDEETYTLAALARR